MGFELQEPRSKVESVNEFAERMVKGLEEAKAALAKAKDEYALYYNHRRIPMPEFKPGDMVWLNHSDIKMTRPSAKFGHCQLGPYPVKKKDWTKLLPPYTPAKPLLSSQHFPHHQIIAH
jgi:hypothetical protein